MRANQYAPENRCRAALISAASRADCGFETERKGRGKAGSRGRSTWRAEGYERGVGELERVGSATTSDGVDFLLWQGKKRFAPRL